MREDDRRSEGALGEARVLSDENDGDNEDEPGRGECHGKEEGSEEDDESESDEEESEEDEEMESGEDEENENELGVGNSPSGENGEEESDTNNEDIDSKFRFTTAITTTSRYFKGFRESTRPERSFIHQLLKMPITGP